MLRYVVRFPSHKVGRNLNETYHEAVLTLLTLAALFRAARVALLGWGHTSARSTYVATHILHDGRCCGHHTARVNLGHAVA
jgi:hypothetical protein